MELHGATIRETKFCFEGLTGFGRVVDPSSSNKKQNKTQPQTTKNN